MNTKGLSRSIPSDVKAKVREACGFGCVICGTIPYDYDHLETQFADAEQHDPDDIVLLCQNHHRLKGAGVISPATIKKFRTERKALDAETRFKLPIATAPFNVWWGSNIINCNEHDIVVDNHPILTFKYTENELEPVLLSGEFRNHRGQIICRVEENSFVSRSSDLGDLTVISNRFSYYLPGGRASLCFTLKENELQITEAFHVKDDAHVLVIDGMLQVGNIEQAVRNTNNRLTNVGIGISVNSAFDNFSYEGLDPLKIPSGTVDSGEISDSPYGIMVDGRSRQKITSNYDRLYA